MRLEHSEDGWTIEINIDTNAMDENNICPSAICVYPDGGQKWGNIGKMSKELMEALLLDGDWYLHSLLFHYKNRYPK